MRRISIRVTALLGGVTLLLLSMVFAIIMAPSVAGAVSEAEAAAKVKQVKDEANAAANDLNKARFALEKIGYEVEQTKAKIADGEARAGELQGVAAERGRRAYLQRRRGPSGGSFESVLEGQRQDLVLEVVTGNDENAIIELAGLREDLSIQRDKLEVQKASQNQLVDSLNKKKKALDAKLKEAERIQKEAAEKAKRDAAARSSARTAYQGSAGIIINPGGGAFVCPIQGSIAFTNDWGAARSGGRRHKGNDLFSPMGTPNVAVVPGRVSHSNGGLGGMGANLFGDNGVLYYYAHLSAFAGGPRNVVAGEVIGYTGNTGNARGGSPHTHFEIRPGGSPINPYPTLIQYC